MQRLFFQSAFKVAFSTIINIKHTGRHPGPQSDLWHVAVYLSEVQAKAQLDSRYEKNRRKRQKQRA